jgi:hypothetical protein
MLNKELQSELLEIVALDQDLRNRAMKDMGSQELVAQIGEADRRHTRRLREIVEVYGWPGNSLVCTDGAHAAWLLVQHADHNPAFQTDCLEKMIAAGPDEVDQQNLAYLTDRVRVNTGQPQLYGTQFWIDDNGVFGPRPMENAGRIDEYRTAVGLGPFEEYRQRMMQLNEDAQKTQ